MLPMQGFRRETNPLGALPERPPVYVWKPAIRAGYMANEFVPTGFRPVRLRGLRGLEGGIPGAISYPQNICLDQSENTIACGDPNCTFGDCGAGGPQLTTGALCLDQAETQVECGSPDCTWGDCIAAAKAPGVPAGVTPSGPTGGTASAAAVGPGSYLTYTGQWQTTTTKSANDIVQSVIGSLNSAGLQVTNFSSNAGMLANTKILGLAEGGQIFQVSLQLRVVGSGFAQSSDAGSIVDHAVYAASGKMPLSSYTAYAGGGVVGTGGAPPPPPATSFTMWLENNATWIGLGVLAIAVLPSVMKKIL